MVTLATFAEDFESGTDGAQVTGLNSIFDYTYPGDAVFSSAAARTGTLGLGNGQARYTGFCDRMPEQFSSLPEIYERYFRTYDDYPYEAFLSEARAFFGSGDLEEARQQLINSLGIYGFPVPRRRPHVLAARVKIIERPEFTTVGFSDVLELRGYLEPDAIIPPLFNLSVGHSYDSSIWPEIFYYDPAQDYVHELWNGQPPPSSSDSIRHGLVSLPVGEWLHMEIGYANESSAYFRIKNAGGGTLLDETRAIYSGGDLEITYTMPSATVRAYAGPARWNWHIDDVEIQAPPCPVQTGLKGEVRRRFKGLHRR